MGPNVATGLDLIFGSELTGDGSFLLWILWALAAATYVNFLLRIGLVHRHFGADDGPEL